MEMRLDEPGYCNKVRCIHNLAIKTLHLLQLVSCHYRFNPASRQYECTTMDNFARIIHGYNCSKFDKSLCHEKYGGLTGFDRSDDRLFDSLDFHEVNLAIAGFHVAPGKDEPLETKLVRFGDAFFYLVDHAYFSSETHLPHSHDASINRRVFQ